MVKDNVINFPTEEPDSEFMEIIEGEKWYTYLVDYKTEDGTFSFQVKARNWEEAESNVKYIRETAQVIGQLYEVIE